MEPLAQWIRGAVLQRTHTQSPAPTSNYSSKGSVTLFWPPQIPMTMRDIHIHVYMYTLNLKIDLYALWWLGIER